MIEGALSFNSKNNRNSDVFRNSKSNLSNFGFETIKINNPKEIKAKLE